MNTDRLTAIMNAHAQIIKKLEASGHDLGLRIKKDARPMTQDDFRPPEQK